jgi:hypothetical protein
MQDLIVLCADLDMKLGLAALLARSQHLGCCAIDFEVYTHDMRDPGVFQKAHDFLRPQCNRFSHAVAICDLEGCGREQKHPREEIEKLIEQRLRSNGWNDRAAAIVIAPELEAWVWVDRRALAAQVGWPGGEASLKGWLVKQGLLSAHQGKPARPKESLRRALRHTNKSLSSAFFAALGRMADTTSCTDPAFAKLVSRLQQWFPSR